MKLFIHIGFGKTGTTAIQNQLEENTKPLNDIDIIYPETGKRNNAHYLLAPLGMKKFDSNTSTLYSKLLNELKESKASTCILSCESFCYMEESFIQEISKYFNDFHVKIVFYIRNQIDLFSSSYMQHLKVGDYGYVDYKVFFKKHKASYNLMNRITPWMNVFGKENIISKVYDKAIIGNDIVSNFLEIVGINDKLSVNHKMYNSSLLPDFVPLLERVYHLNLPTETRDTIILELLHLSKKFKKLSTPLLQGKESIEYINSYYLESNQLFASLFLSDEEKKILIGKPH